MLLAGVDAWWAWIAYLGVLERLEKGRDADEADLIVPHDDVLLFRIVGYAKCVLEDCNMGQLVRSK